MLLFFFNFPVSFASELTIFIIRSALQLFLTLQPNSIVLTANVLKMFRALATNRWQNQSSVDMAESYLQ